MTGIFVRIERAGRWQTLEFDELTDRELEVFARRFPDDGWRWAIRLAQWIRDHEVLYQLGRACPQGQEAHLLRGLMQLWPDLPSEPYAWQALRRGLVERSTPEAAP